MGGLGDLLGKAVHIVKGLEIKPSAVFEAIGAVVGSVTSTIPFVGPALDVGASALQAIFSDDSAPTPASGERASALSDPLVRPVLTNLERRPAEISIIVDGFKAVEDNLSGKIQVATDAIRKDLAGVGVQLDALSASVRKVQAGVDKILQYLRLADYERFHTEVHKAMVYFSTSQPLLQELTAMSGRDKFQTFFPKDGSKGLTHHRNDLYEAVSTVQSKLEKVNAQTVPSQEMFELYIFAVHWLLMYDKAIIVVQGLRARSYQVREQYGDYLTTLNEMNVAISYARKDALDACKCLRAFISAILAMRTSDDMINYTTTFTNGLTESFRLDDHWEPFAVGWISPAKMKTAMSGVSLVEYFDVPALTAPPQPPNGRSYDSLTAREKATFDEQMKKYEEAIHKDERVGDHPNKERIKWHEDGVTGLINVFRNGPTMTLYTMIVRRSLEVFFEPALVLVDNLEQSLRQWNSRVPVTPSVSLGKEPIRHITVHSTDKQLEVVGGQKTSNLWGKKIIYTITYVNSFGESTSATWSSPKTLQEETKLVTVQVHRVTFDTDTTANCKPIEVGGKEAPRDRGIRRRIYYEIEGVQQFLGDIGEDTNFFYHVLVPNTLCLASAPAPKELTHHNDGGAAAS